MYWTKAKTLSDPDTLPKVRIDDEKDYLSDLEFREELLELADRLTYNYWK
jgi:hypothetical protein